MSIPNSELCTHVTADKVSEPPAFQEYLQDPERVKLLDSIHTMRLKMFDHRTSQEQATNSVKPYLPMLSSDEKELILE